VTLVRRDGSRVSKRVHSDGSYCSSSDLRVYFGLGSDTSAQALEVLWPGGGRERWDIVHVDQLNELAKGTGKPQ
jgi:hypothetical protein